MESLFSETPVLPGGQAGVAGGPGRYVRVAVERGIDQAQTATGLTYSTPTDLAVGERVDVPLGRGDRRASGIVVEVGGAELAAGIPRERIKPILRRTGAALSGTLIDLARWMASYYVCPLGMVLATMMPAAVKQRIGMRTRVLIDRVDAQAEAALAEVKLPPSADAAWKAVVSLGRDPWPLAPKDLTRRIEARSVAPINRLVKAGLLRRVERQEVSVGRDGPVWGKYLVEQHDGAAQVPGEPPALTREQGAVVEGIAASLGRFGVNLLRGVTGSGKTEVYLRLIDRVVQRGGTALVLVPEISLTPQTAGRFIERFRLLGSAAVAVLHSGLSASQRHRQWALASSGAARVVVGARSAVFAPLAGLGLIVVDEEHASDYKQDQLPRYHARDVAIKRAQLEGCPVLLGSATPSLESWANAAATNGQTGKYRLWELHDRVGGGRLPRVEVVDIQAETRAAAARAVAAGDQAWRWSDAIGPTLQGAMARTLDDGGQVLLLLNRRGYANYICCPQGRCGWVMRCDDCDAAMVYHLHRAIKTGGLVRCHHCLAEQVLPTVCPLCGSRVSVLGSGTQRVEEELARKLGGRLAPGQVLRVDGDTMRSARDYFDALARFAAGQVRVLLGTQMISKGLDFPNVWLAGVINADTALNLPDFRAVERTFQLVCQVAGRAGRGEHPGRVIVQTLSSHSPAIQFAASHDYTGFATDELRLRARAGLPPVTRMARIVVRDKDHEKATKNAARLVDALREAIREAGASEGIRLTGPMPCAIARIAGFHRLAVELVATRRSALQEVLGAVRQRGLLTSDAHTAVDIDPIALL